MFFYPPKLLQINSFFWSTEKGGSTSLRSIFSLSFLLLKQQQPPTTTTKHSHNKRPKSMSSVHPLQKMVSSLRQGDVVTATNFHERHQELAAAVDIADEQKEANKSLINVS